MSSLLQFHEETGLYLIPDLPFPPPRLAPGLGARDQHADRRGRHVPLRPMARAQRGRQEDHKAAGRDRGRAPAAAAAAASNRRCPTHIILLRPPLSRRCPSALSVDSLDHRSHGRRQRGAPGRLAALHVHAASQDGRHGRRARLPRHVQHEQRRDGGHQRHGLLRDNRRERVIG